MKVAVIMGGRSREREISIKTGTQIGNALKEKNYDVIRMDLDDEFVNNIKREDPDVVFIALHGKYGEDGTIQGLLDILGYPYVGSGVLASALAMDKARAKQFLLTEGILTPLWFKLKKEDINRYIKEIIQNIRERFTLPVAVKPNSEGSSIGTYLPEDFTELENALIKASEYDNEILVEEFIRGTEITVGVLGNTDVIPLPVIEITTKTKFYDYESKYTKGLSEHVIPARIGKEMYNKAQDCALKIHKALGCRGFSRVDFIVREDNLYFLEVNTIPGMTELSLFPDAARHMGLDFSDLIMKLINLAMDC